MPPDLGSPDHAPPADPGSTPTSGPTGSASAGSAGEPSYRSPDLTLLGPEHVRRYRETGGEVGYLWNGVPTLLLTTTGRRTGSPRTSALIFGRDGDRYLVIASMGGAPTHPAWYLNLTAHPTATIQVRDQVLAVEASTASADEKPRLWAVMQSVWPNYAVYQQRTTRDIPVVVLTPEGG